jgi:hypothetical protein
MPTYINLGEDAMSTHIHCSGCSRHVEVAVNEQHELIKGVEFKVGSGFASANPLKTDLCVRCIDRLSTQFFGVTEMGSYDRDVETVLLGPPDLPTFLDKPIEETALD